VAHSKGVELALDAAKELSSVGIDAEVINLRSLRPIDINTIIKSVVGTYHIISIEQGCPYVGIGSEISTQITESKI